MVFASVRYARAGKENASCTLLKLSARLLLGALTGIVARYMRAIPLPLIQIALGALIAWPQPAAHRVRPRAVPAAVHSAAAVCRRLAHSQARILCPGPPILLLALGLVLFTVLGLGYLIHWMIPEIPLTVAFALAAVVSPTDAVAVSAITRNLGMPEKTMHVLEGESLLNDASGLVALKFALPPR
jgi:CPA1 family monovalent cation:H+ antiporter